MSSRSGRPRPTSPLRLQGADVSVADVAAARAQIIKQRADLAASRQLGGIVTGLVGQARLAETQGIRARRRHCKVGGRPDARPGGSEEGAGQSRRAGTAQSEGPAGAGRARSGAPRPAQYGSPRAGQTEPSPTCDWPPANMSAPGQPLLSFLESGPRWISADMRENQLGNVKPGQDVTVALDIKPGKLFRGRVHSIGWGVSQGDEAPTGQLSTMPADQGWLRDPQRFPVRIMVLPDEAKEAGYRRRAQWRAGQRHHLHRGHVDHESDRPAVDQGHRPAELPAIAMATALDLPAGRQSIPLRPQGFTSCFASASAQRRRSSSANGWGGSLRRLHPC